MMSSAALPSRESGAAAPGPGHRPRRRLVGLVTVVLGVVAVVAWAVGACGGHHPRSGGVSDNGYPTSVATVTEGPLVAQLSASGTLEYTTAGGSGYSVVNQAPGTFSKLPSPGEAFSRGQVVYRVSDDPVILLYGSTPVYRSLHEGDTGPDVRELNANLVALGYATSSDYFSYETAYALERLQYKLGEQQTGSLTEGQAVVLPGQIRISTVSATLGTNAAPGSPIMQASSTSREVVVELDAAEQTEVTVGERVQITLPDGQATPGTVSGIGTVASSSGSSGSGATLPVYITLKHPKAAGTLDQAPVTVEITTAAVKHAVIVPIDALLALSGGGYAVEIVGAQRVHHLAAVTLGTFDDADGTVQVTGRVQAGERIVVPNA